MNVLRHIALVTVTALVPAFAFAQGAATTPAPGTTAPAKATAKDQKRGERFKAADKNGDGAISKAEADGAGMKRLSKNFDAIDANKDGKVTPDEMKAYRTAHKGEHKGSTAKPTGPVTPAAPAAPAK
jgi:hypothetical protein